MSEVEKKCPTPTFKWQVSLRVNYSTLQAHTMSDQEEKSQIFNFDIISTWINKH